MFNPAPRARYFLQTTPERFDPITGEPPPPRMANVVNLYTREYFALARERLNPGGVLTYWLPIHSLPPRNAKRIIRAFCDVFGDCSLWNGWSSDLMLVGTRPLALETLRRLGGQERRGPEMIRLEAYLLARAGRFDDSRTFLRERAGQLGSAAQAAAYSSWLEHTFRPEPGPKLQPGAERTRIDTISRSTERRGVPR